MFSSAVEGEFSGGVLVPKQDDGEKRSLIQHQASLMKT